jgi:fumarate reductase subunit D
MTQGCNIYNYYAKEFIRCTSKLVTNSIIGVAIWCPLYHCRHHVEHCCHEMQCEWKMSL